MSAPYETKAERAARIRQWVYLIGAVIYVAAGIMVALWGLGLPTP